MVTLGCWVVIAATQVDMQFLIAVQTHFTARLLFLKCIKV